MKNVKSKILCLALSVVTCFTAAACGEGIRPDNSSGQVNKAKTQLYIGLGTNGLTEYMEDTIKKFEDKYKDVSFEDGKTGVQVFFKYDEKFSNFDTLPINYTGYQEKLVITENVPYDRIKKMALEITDVATTPLNKSVVASEKSRTETETIAGKMLPQFKKYFDADGKYYALPSQFARMGLVYDESLFEKNGLYFAAENATHSFEYTCNNVYTGKEGTYLFVDEGYTKDELSKGPDGKAGTYDDGLPATYEEFFALCDLMQKEFGIEPVRWAGKVQSYMMGVAESLAADYEGDEYVLKTNFNGTAHNLVKFDDNGKMVFGADGKPETYSLAINNENGHELTAQLGFYNALKFMDAFLKSDYYDKDLCFNGTSDHLTTQTKYLLSDKESKVSSIAMLAEGSWWYGEAANTFKDMAQKYGESWSAKKRKFAYLPLPKADESLIGKQESTFAVLNMTSFITKDAAKEQADVAKLFLRDMYSREGLLNFVSITGQMRPYTLNLTDDEYDSLTRFGKSNYDTLKNNNILYLPSDNVLYRTNNSILDATYNFHWTSNLGETLTFVLRAGSDAKTYFEEVHDFWNKSKWDSYYKGVAY